MGRVYDNWGRLVGVMLKREQLRELARADSLSVSTISSDFSTISSNFSSTISLSSPRRDQSQLNLGFEPEGPSTSYYRDSIVEGRPIPRSPDGILQLPSLRPISFRELKNATRNFRPNRIIGEGTFGRVFKGWINDHNLTSPKPRSGTTVAIKQLNPYEFREFGKWLATMSYLAQLQHPNLIKLFAYCHKGSNLLLVYEFMPRGSLDSYLLERGDKCLHWAKRVKVAVGVARGLSFLHDAKIHMIHRDITSAHILLDKEYNAKLSGLYLACDKTDMSTRISGTDGYAAPEYASTGNLTEKCDVYGFGIVLLELLSGRCAIDISTRTHIVDWARPYLSKKKKVDLVMDPRLEGQYNKKEAVIVANLALQCVRHQPKSRPRMAKVLAALEQLRVHTKTKTMKISLKKHIHQSLYA